MSLHKWLNLRNLIHICPLDLREPAIKFDWHTHHITLMNRFDAFLMLCLTKYTYMFASSVLYWQSTHENHFTTDSQIITSVHILILKEKISEFFVNKSFVSFLSGFVNSDLFDVGSIAFNTLSVQCGIFDHMLPQMETSNRNYEFTTFN